MSELHGMDRERWTDPFVTGRFLVLQSGSGPSLFDDQSTLRNLGVCFRSIDMRVKR